MSVPDACDYATNFNWSGNIPTDRRVDSLEYMMIHGEVIDCFERLLTYCLEDLDPLIRAKTMDAFHYSIRSTIEEDRRAIGVTEDQIFRLTRVAMKLAMEDPIGTTRTFAVGILDTVDDDDAMEVLLQVLQNDKNDNTRAAAARVLKYYTQESVKDMLIGTIYNDNNHRVRMFAVYALVNFFDDDSLGAVIDSIADRSRGTTNACIHVLTSWLDSGMIDESYVLSDTFLKSIVVVRMTSKNKRVREVLTRLLRAVGEEPF